MKRLPLRRFRQPEKSPVAGVYDFSGLSETGRAMRGASEIGCLDALIKPVKD